MKYYIKLDDETHGPFSLEHIRQRISERAYQSSDLVRMEDDDDWTTLGSLKEFTEALAPKKPLSNPMAVASLTFALSSGFFLVLMASIPSSNSLFPFILSSLGAIVLGHSATRRITHSPRDFRGYRMARTSIRLSYLMLLLLPVILLISPIGVSFQEKGKQAQAINNCRQIIISLRLYAADNDGKYPDNLVPNASSSNEVFRLLFKEDILEIEKIFGAARSPYIPDGNIGEKPDFSEALKSGENHWAMTKGLYDSADGTIPLVFENPSDANWPPKWNASEPGRFTKWITKFLGGSTGRQSLPGQAWLKGKVIIGLNDSSVELYSLESENGENIGLKPYPDGKPIFPVLDPKLEILNVAQ